MPFSSRSPAGLGILAGLRAWPVRRRVLTGALVVPMTLLYASVGTAWEAWWALPVTAAQAVLAAAIIASYVPVPGAGRRLDLGCTPCAAVAGMTVLGSLVLRGTDPWDGGIGLSAVLLLVFGLLQRVRDSGACATRPPVPSRVDDRAV